MFVVQHAQMLVVRKEGKAHDQYNKFRSAFELMEAVGSEPCDSFSEMTDDLPPVEMLEKRMMMQHKVLLADIHKMKTKIHEVETENSQLKAKLEAKSSQLEVEIHEVKTENSQLKNENVDLRCRIEKLERHT